jgi:nitrite reductase/ring-hydroxylating ferredoxin subunit
MVIGKEVICPLHARKINLENGSVANEKERVKVCGLKILDGEIFLPEPS